VSRRRNGPLQRSDMSAPAPAMRSIINKQGLQRQRGLCTHMLQRRPPHELFHVDHENLVGGPAAREAAVPARHSESGGARVLQQGGGGGARYTMAFRLCWTTVAFVLPLGVAPRHFMSVVHMSAMLGEGDGGQARKRQQGNGRG
jgi:hypothetical protein